MRTEGSSRRPSILKVTVLAVGVVVVLVALFVGSALATDRSQFCNTCHEMRPYCEKWTAGAHADLACIDCHVNPGLPARFAHKLEALKEVRAHFTGDNKFPRPLPANVPDSRCLRCHPNPGPKNPPRGFSHADHREKAPCQRCHATAGHDVTTAELKAAGILDPESAASREVLARQGLAVAVPGRGVANVPGHVGVACSRCHDMAATRCLSCHQPPSKPNHAGRTRCVECHKPGRQWAFAHPTGGNCRECHNPPANHFGSECGRCHSPQRTFAQANFTHPGNTGEHSWRSFACVKCHPRGFARASCTCHGGRPPAGD